MEHQYPGAISGDENMLAELMLPDQAHVRNQDWTIFFLHKETTEEEEAAEAEKLAGVEEGKTGVSGEALLGKGEGEEVEEQEEAEGGEGPPLIYVLNLVNTKQDTTARRLCPTRK